MVDLVSPDRSPELSPELTPELAAFVTQATGAVAISCKRLSGGGSRLTLSIDAASRDGGVVPLVLRLEEGGSHSGTGFSLEREYHAYQALAEHNVPTPRAWGLFQGGAALLLERLEGVSDFTQMQSDAQPAVALSFMEALARLHALPAEALDLPGFERPRTAREHATIDLERWRTLAQQSCWDEPIVRYAFGWLDARAPARVQRTVLVQGDTGPGNFLALSGAVTGLIDWEFCHIGDPMDDLAWLEYRSGAHFPLFEAGFQKYESISGIAPDRASIDYYHLMVLLRCAVTVALGKVRGGALGVIPYRFAYQDYLAKLADRLTAAEGVATAPPSPLTDALSPSTLYAEARNELRTHVLTQPMPVRAIAAATAAMTALIHLEQRERMGAALSAQDEAELADYQRTRGAGNLAEGAQEAGRVGDTVMLELLARRAWRARLMWPRSR